MTVAILAGFAVWLATLTLVEGEIFRDMREAVDRLHKRHNNWWTFKLRYLTQCQLCTGIWVAGIVALFINPVIGSGFFGWGLTALAIKGIGHLILVFQKWIEAVTDAAKSDAVSLNGENDWADCLGFSEEKVLSK